MPAMLQTLRDTALKISCRMSFWLLETPCRSYIGKDPCVRADPLGNLRAHLIDFDSAHLIVFIVFDEQFYRNVIYKDHLFSLVNIHTVCVDYNFSIFILKKV